MLEQTFEDPKALLAWENILSHMLEVSVIILRSTWLQPSLLFITCHSSPRMTPSRNEEEILPALKFHQKSWTSNRGHKSVKNFRFILHQSVFFSKQDLKNSIFENRIILLSDLDMSFPVHHGKICDPRHLLDLASSTPLKYS